MLILFLPHSHRCLCPGRRRRRRLRLLPDGDVLFPGIGPDAFEMLATDCRQILAGISRASLALETDLVSPNQ